MPTTVRTPFIRDIRAQDVVVLYSGGSDSSLTAIKAYYAFTQVHLVTVMRRGLTHQGDLLSQVKKLQGFFGDNENFQHIFLRAEKIFRYIAYERYLANLWKYGAMMMSNCGLCKLAFHTRVILYCLEQGYTHVWDGSVKEMQAYPDQNENIALRLLQGLYARYGITFESPIFYEGKDVQEELFRIRFNRTPLIKMTKADKQIVCTQQALFAMFVRYYLQRHPYPEYEKRLSRLYEAKVQLVDHLLQEFTEKRDQSRLSALMEDHQ